MIDNFKKINILLPALEKIGSPVKITSNEIKGVCFDTYGLPKSQSEFYHFLDILIHLKILSKELRATYLINYKIFHDILKEWEKQGRFL